MSAIAPTTSPDGDRIIAETDAAVARIRKAREAIGKVIYGQESVVDRALITILAGGHGLLIGVPGLAKTKLVETLGTVLGLSARRVQFTPDLMPSDIIGSEVMDRPPTAPQLPLHPGGLCPADGRRDDPRQPAQSALLQHRIHDVPPAPDPRRRSNAATQNPLEQEGTYPLPEAQLDRFLLQIDVVYPDRDAERRMLFETTGAHEATTSRVFDAEELRATQQLVRRMPVGESVVEGILELVSSARPGTTANEHLAQAIAWGPGPRASQALMLASRARALIDGRYAPSLDDVVALAEPVLQHRMALGFAARADGLTVRDVIAELKARIG
jgi:MoxR-like ATPase